ncbi:hypothetical protein [Cupriavidus necator]|uniref:hypothetical protein n=1 Tax=Cupriavidus necator TaxID=106590 RepID=UPI0039C0B913
MPEQLTRHPEVTLQVLRSAGARCGEGVPQQILKTCPRDRFCQLPGGEICVYGLDGAAAMTQITPADWQALCPLAGARQGGTPSMVLPGARQGATQSMALPGAQQGDTPLMALAGAAAVGLLAGLLVAAALARWRRGRRQS